MKSCTTTSLGLRALRHVCVVAFLASGAQADIVPIGQTRTLDTEAGVNSPAGPVSDSDHADAVDFGPFSQSIQSSASSFGASASASASQNSQITISGFSAIGSASASASGGNDFSQSGSNSRSYFFLEFDLMQPGSVSGLLTRQISGGSIFANARSTLSIPGIGSWQADSGHPSATVSVNLPAGNYLVTIEAVTSNFSGNFESGTATASFSLQLVPEPSTLLLVVGVVGLLRLRR